MSSSVAVFVLRQAIRPIIKPRHFSSLASSLAAPRVLAPKTLTPSRILSPISVRFASAKAVTAEDEIKRADRTLLRVLEDEIECAEETNEQPPKEAELPKDSPFEIIDNRGDQAFILKREFQGEKILVSVTMKNDEKKDEDEEEDKEEDADEEKEEDKEEVADEEKEEDKEEDAVEEKDADEEEAEQDAAEGENIDEYFNQRISLVITIDKGAGVNLKFFCNLDAEDLEIESMGMKRPGESDFVGPDDGPDFWDLDEGLQRALHKYLEDRGIKVSLYEFLRAYMITKYDREYTVWLKDLKEFVGK